MQSSKLKVALLKKYDDEEAAEVPKHQPRPQNKPREAFVKPSVNVVEEVKVAVKRNYS